jgi:hypothetical protein
VVLSATADSFNFIGLRVLNPHGARAIGTGAGHVVPKRFTQEF